MEKEWMAALIDGNLDSIYQMTMADSAYINRKGFINGWVRSHDITIFNPLTTALYLRRLCTGQLKWDGKIWLLL